MTLQKLRGRFTEKRIWTINGKDADCLNLVSTKPQRFGNVCGVQDPGEKKFNSSLAGGLLARKNQKFPSPGHTGKELLQIYPRRELLERKKSRNVDPRPHHAPIYPTRWSIRKKTLRLGEDCKILEVSKNIPNSNLTQSNQWVLERYWRWVKNEQSSLKESDDCSRAGRTFRLLKDVCSKQKNVFKEFQRVHELWAPDRTLVQKKYT